MRLHFLNMFLVILFYFCFSKCEDFCEKDKCQEYNQNRYLFYDVNPPEGFNLRRDVYMRFSILMHKMKESKDPKLNRFKLVLPPWSHLMHWSYSETPEYIPWGLFFDMKSLQIFAPVIEMHEYFYTLLKEKYNKVKIDEVYVLQHFEDMFETGNFEDRWKVEKCSKPPRLRYFYYPNVTSNSVRCLSYHGPATKLTDLLKQSKAKTILLDHAEIALHDNFGNKLYWQARRSMRFNRGLREIARNFRQDFLNSTDDKDRTDLPLKWTDEKPKRSAKGGPYLAVHLRRKDFVRSRPNDIPDIDSVAKQIRSALKKHQLSNVFVATDASELEFKDLEQRLSPQYEVYRYVPPMKVLEKYKEGGVAIIDQIICSYARYFIGTGESTFSFRIQEEREILGFPTEATFNAFCKDETSCNKPSVWKIMY